MKKNCFSPSLKKEGGFIKVKKIGLFFATFFLILSFFSLPNALASLPVIQIKIQGNRVIKEDEIRKVLAGPGFSFSEEKVREQMQAIYNMGYFFSVKVLKEEITRGIILTYEVEEYPVVNNIEFNGVGSGEVKKLKSLTTLEIGKPWNYRKAEESRKKILDYFKQIGYTQAKVSFSPPLKGDEEGTAVFFIKKGQRARVIEVEISGNIFFEDTKIRSWMRTRFKRYFDPEVLKKDIKRIVDEYQKNGFYFARVKIAALDFSERYRTRWVRVFLQIDEGARYRMGRLSISGNSVFSDSEIKIGFRPKEGDIFDTQKIKDSIRKIQKMYGQKGYLYVVIDNNLHFDRDRKTVDVKLLIKEGTQVNVGKIKIEGNNVSKERIFKHTILLKQGNVFNVDKMIESWRRLYNLGFFEKVDMEPVGTTDPSIMDLLVKVKERERSGKFLLGTSYSSSMGLAGFVQFSKDNLWGQGKMLSIDWEFGQRKNNYQLNYVDRWWRDTSTRLEFNLYNKAYKFYEDSEGYAKTDTGIGISLGRPWFSNFTFFLDLESKKTVISSIEGKKLPSGLVEGESAYQSVKPSLLWDSRVRDEAFNSYKGLYTLLSVEKSGGFLGGDVDFTKYYAEVRSYYRYGKFWKLPSLALRLRGRWGDNLPLDEEFYIGGQDTLRGYEINEFRGSKVLLGTVEVRIPVSNNFLSYLFVDAGRIQNTNIEEKIGYGFGIRLNTPIGVLRFDYGISEEGEPHFYFGMGDVF